MNVKLTRSPSELGKDESNTGPTLGQLLAAAREKLGISRQEAARRAHLSLNYVEMLESESFKKVSDQIYLVPFLRRYATALGLDGEELAMRFVRDVQYLENESARMAEPVLLETKRPYRRYSWVAVAAAALAAIALARFGQSYYREQSSGAVSHAQNSSTSAGSNGQSLHDQSRAKDSTGALPTANQAVQPMAPTLSDAPGNGTSASSPQGSVSSAGPSAVVSAPSEASAQPKSSSRPRDPASTNNASGSDRNASPNNDSEEDAAGTE